MSTHPSPPALQSSTTILSLEELGFACEQLAGLMRTGVPLEGGLLEVAKGMTNRQSRQSWTDLEKDLAAGIQLHEALQKHGFPPLFISLIRAGQTAQNMPRMLNLLADHYHQMNDLQLRFKGVMTYPLIILIGTMIVSFVALAFVTRFLKMLETDGITALSHWFMTIQLWTPPLIMLSILVGLLILGTRQSTQFRLKRLIPGFKESALSHLASFIHILLQRGVPLPDSLQLARETEPDPRMKQELSLWESRIAQGGTPFPDLSESKGLVPPLFKWLITSSPGQWEDGFARAAEIYRARALHRMDLALYASVPVTILILGMLMIFQFVPVVVHLTRYMESLGGP